MTIQEKKAREMISNLTLAELLDEWELTSQINKPNEDWLSIATVRGWLMDEFESRNPKAFEAWLDSDYPDDASLRDYMTR